MQGYLDMIGDLETWLAEVTGYDTVSVQPNAGTRVSSPGSSPSAGTTGPAGTRRARSCLIPSSAHGTNAASAVLAGMRVVVVACDEDGNVDPTTSVRRDDAARRAARGADDHVPVDARRLRARHPGDLRTRCTTPAVRSYVDGANLTPSSGTPVGDFRRDVLAPQPAQDVLHPHGGGGPGVVPWREGATTHPSAGHPMAQEADRRTGA